MAEASRPGAGRDGPQRSPSVCPAGPGEEKEHKDERCGRADGLRVIKAIKYVSWGTRGGVSSLLLMNGEWRGRCLFKGLLPGFGEGAELNGVTAAPTSACLGLKGGREAAISSDKLQTSQPLAMKGALGSADKSRCVSCLSALIGLGFVCRPVSARLAALPGNLPGAKREGGAGVR